MAVTKPTQKEIREFYGQALDRCLSGFAKLDDKEWGKKASDEWTAKEHLAHLVGTEEDETLPLTRQALDGGPGTLDLLDGIIVVDGMIDVEANVLRAAARSHWVVQDPDGDVRPGNAHKDDFFSAIDLLEFESVAVEANGLFHVTDGHDEQE